MSVSLPLGGQVCARRRLCHVHSARTDRPPPARKQPQAVAGKDNTVCSRKVSAMPFACTSDHPSTKVNFASKCQVRSKTLPQCASRQYPPWHGQVEATDCVNRRPTTRGCFTIRSVCNLMNLRQVRNPPQKTLRHLLPPLKLLTLAIVTLMNQRVPPKLLPLTQLMSTLRLSPSPLTGSYPCSSAAARTTLGATA